MRINVIALSATAALFWSAAILVVASANLIWPTYGRAFLELAASMYPGYHPSPAIGSIITADTAPKVTGSLGVMSNSMVSRKRVKYAAPRSPIAIPVAPNKAP